MSERMRRVDEQLREVLAEAVRGLKDPRIGFVTITGVRTSPDLGHAQVYYTVLADDEDTRAATAEGLDRAATALRRQLAQRVRLRRVPDLHFVADPATEHGQRIEALLREVARDRPPEAEEDEEDEG